MVENLHMYFAYIVVLHTTHCSFAYYTLQFCILHTVALHTMHYSFPYFTLQFYFIVVLHTSNYYTLYIRSFVCYIRTYVLYVSSIIILCTKHCSCMEHLEWADQEISSVHKPCIHMYYVCLPGIHLNVTPMHIYSDVSRESD